MKLHKIDLENEYEKICKIWEMRKFPSPPKDTLSEYGYAIKDNDNYVAFCWIYPTVNCKSCWFGFPTTNPEYDKNVRGTALEIVMNDVCSIAKELGYKYIMTTSNVDLVIERLNKMDFKLTDRNVGLYFRGL